MRLLHLLVPVLSIGCGLGTTVVGEGSSELSSTSSTDPLFECTFDGGVWPGATAGSRITLTRAGDELRVGSRTMRIDRVDKSGPFDANVFYLLKSGDDRLSIDGVLLSPDRARPMYLTRRSGGTTETFSCGPSGIFDDSQLDALVTATNGTRRR